MGTALSEKIAQKAIVNVLIPPTVPRRPGGFDQAESAISSVPAKVLRQHVADSRNAAVCAAIYGEPLQCKRRPRTIPQQRLEADNRHAVGEPRA